MFDFDEKINIAGNYVKFNISSNVNINEDLKGVDDFEFFRA